MSRKALAALLKSAASKWSDDNVPTLGAALAYYALLSIAPLMILVVGVCGLFLSRTLAERELLQEIRNDIGYSEANTVQTLLDNAHRASSGIFAAAVALATLLFGASGLFVELRGSLNAIWDAPPPRSSTWRNLISERLTAFVMVLGFAVLVLISLLASAAFTVVAKFSGPYVPLHAAVIAEVTNFLVSYLAMAVAFALIFKFVPDVPIAWRDVGIGAAATALLFMIGKSLLAVYIGTAGVGSTYGAAGSLIALVVWVYYSAQIFFFGAEFTRAYADSFGSRSGRSSFSPEARRKAAVN